jgi:hypothetical protein
VRLYSTVSKLGVEKQTLATYALVVTFFVSVLLHNLIYGLFGFGEILFFLLSLLSAFLFPFSIVYNVFTYVTRKKPKDLWKLGFLGLIGLLGLIQNRGRYSFTFFYSFFGLFAFFGLKK